MGYLVACSSDEASLKAANETLPMQRTSTIMEGADCVISEGTRVKTYAGGSASCSGEEAGMVGGS